MDIKKLFRFLFIISFKSLGADSHIAVPYVADEATSYSFKEDFNLPREEIKNCLPLNDFANWFSICGEIQNSRTDIFQIKMGESSFRSPERKQNKDVAPKIEIQTTSGRKLTVSFVELKKLSFNFKSLPFQDPENIKPEIFIDAATKEIFCKLKTASGAEIEVLKSRKLWLLKNVELNRSEMFEQDTIPLRMTRGFSRIGCSAIVFDGMLYKRFKTEVDVAKLDSAPNYTKGFHTFTEQSFKLFQLDKLVGPLHDDEKFSCESRSSSEVCSLFDLQSGRYKNTSANNFVLSRIQARGQLISLKIKKGSSRQQFWQPFHFFVRSETANSIKSNVELKSEGLTQHLVCSNEFTKIEDVKWRVNGEEIVGWDKIWLAPYFYMTGATYSCSVGRGEFSDTFSFDGPARILAPNEVVMKENVPTYLTIESDLPFPHSSVKWLCHFENMDASCEVLHTSNTQAFLKLTPRTKEIKRGILVLALRGEGTSFSSEKKISAILSHKVESHFKNISSSVSIKKDNFRYYCEHEDMMDSKLSYQYLWYLDGRQLGGRENNVVLDNIDRPRNLTCIVSSTTGRERGVGALTTQVRPPDLQIINAAPEIIFDLTRDESFSFVIESPIVAPKKRHCKLILSTGTLLRNQTCTFSVESQYKTRVNVSIDNHLRNKIQSLIADPALEKEPSKLQVNYSYGSFEQSAELPIRFVFPNRKPFIHYAFTFFRNGTQHCQFGVSDPENNHLTSKIIWADNEKNSKTFATFEMKNVSKLKANKNFLHPKLLEGEDSLSLEGSKSASQTDKRLVNCKILASDGTLINEQTARFVGAEDLLSELSRTALLSTYRTSTKEIATPATESAQPDAQVSPSTLPPATFSIKLIKLSSAGKHELTTEPMESILSCDGIGAFCRQIFIRNNRLKIANTSDVAPGNYFLSTQSPTGQQNYFLIELENKSFIPHQQTELESCQTSLKLYRDGTLPLWQDLKILVMTKLGEVQIPYSLIPLALANSENELVCAVRTFNESHQSSLIRYSALKIDSDEGKLNTLSLAGSRLDLASTAYLISPALTSELPFASSFKITECKKNNGSRCTVAPLTLHQEEISNSTGIDFKIGYTAFGKKREKNISVNYAVGKRPQFIDARLFLTHPNRFQVTCESIQATGQKTFSIFAKGKLVSTRTSQNSSETFDLVPKSSLDNLSCAIESSVGVEVSQLAVQDSTNNMYSCIVQFDDGTMAPWADCGQEISKKSGELDAKIEEAVKENFRHNSVKGIKYYVLNESQEVLHSRILNIPEPENKMAKLELVKVAGFTDLLSREFVCHYYRSLKIGDDNSKPRLCDASQRVALDSATKVDFQKLYSLDLTENSVFKEGRPAYYTVPQEEFALHQTITHDWALQRIIRDVRYLRNAFPNGDIELKCSSSQESFCGKIARNVTAVPDLIASDKITRSPPVDKQITSIKIIVSDKQRNLNAEFPILKLFSPSGDSQ